MVCCLESPLQADVLGQLPDLLVAWQTPCLLSPEEKDERVQNTIRVNLENLLHAHLLTIYIYVRLKREQFLVDIWPLKGVCKTLPNYLFSSFYHSCVEVIPSVYRITLRPLEQHKVKDSWARAEQQGCR